MIFNFDSITLSFLVVSSVTLAVVSVLVWYVYSSKKFKNDILDLMDEKFEILLLGEKKEAEEPQTEEDPVTEENFVEKDLNHTIEEIKKFPEEPHE